MQAAKTQSISWSTDLGLFVIRAMLGIVFMFHGAQKLFAWFGGNGLDAFAQFLAKLDVPMPQLSAYLAGGAEFFGGAALLLGLWTRLVSVPLVITMMVAAFAVHGGTFSAQAGGMEYPLTLGVVTFGLLLAGGGRLSLCGLFRPLFCRKSSRKPAS